MRWASSLARRLLPYALRLVVLLAAGALTAMVLSGVGMALVAIFTSPIGLLIAAALVWWLWRRCG